MNDEMDRCIDYLVDREVEYLVHFTPIINLRKILRHGILPRDEIRFDYMATDRERLDGHTDCTCYSIELPNYPMLNRKYLESGKTIEFALLYIDLEALRDAGRSNVFFFPANAASSACQMYHISYFRGFNALERMFREDGRPYGFYSNLPTDVQAEVLVRGRVDPRHIRHIEVGDWPQRNYVQDLGFSRVYVERDMYYCPPELREWSKRRF